jgi:hypothetical protein
VKRETMMLTEAWPKYCVKYRGEERNFPYFVCHPSSKETPFLSNCLNAFMGKLKIRYELHFYRGFTGFVSVRSVNAFPHFFHKLPTL